MDDQRGLSKARDGIAKAVDEAARRARAASAQLGERAGDLRDATKENVEKLAARKPDPYEEAVAEYNRAYTTMNDAGLALLRQRERSTDLIEHVEALVNSIANTPKSIDAAIGRIDVDRAEFLDVEEFARRDLEAARRSAAGGGAGFAAGAAVASVAPSAAMWVATTFGAASTGTAISALSGAAATNAALAWLGGGALAAGGGGTAAGGAILALSGPVGWSVAGAAILTSVALFAWKKGETREQKQEALTSVKRNTARVNELTARVEALLQRTDQLRSLLTTSYREALGAFGADFSALPASEQSRLGALVNSTQACAALLGERVEGDADRE
ncbi:hypothetical protein [Clavibacter zhangzhiyongii]|uniref:Uncharacterized protein n=1 Tax=Clavibacter zhangzhiyongii TaxID=2768071 RepID=A0A7L7Z0M4_9MICO|nr:hypothetical protein [Clavibacter zhangzhiyongii]QOD43268.1 hypothetical protein H9X71_11780 [Clavibacter zhangzhiyongii]